jgi:hypothetical protein
VHALELFPQRDWDVIRGRVSDGFFDWGDVHPVTVVALPDGYNGGFRGQIFSGHPNRRPAPAGLQPIWW